MKDLHLLVREIKDGFDQLGLPYTKDDIINTLIKYYGLKPYQIEELKLWQHWNLQYLCLVYVFLYMQLMKKESNMRCIACNVELTDYESTRQDNEGNYLDMCNYCYNSVKEEITVSNNHDTGIVDHALIDDSINLFVNNNIRTIDNG